MNPPPILIAQQGTPSVPSSATLAETLLWNYIFTCYLGGGAAFDVTYNEERTVACTLALEDAGGIARIRVTASAGVPPLVLIPETTLVAGDGAYRYRTADGSLLSFEDAASNRMRTIVFERLNVIDVQSARAAIHDIRFPEPLLPSLENDQRIELGGGPPAPLAAHLNALLHALIASSPFATQPASIECRYGYTIGGLPLEAPIVLVTRQDLAIGFDEPLLDQIAASVRQWLDTVQPPSTGARLIFGVKFWNAIPRIDAPLLRLTNLSLSMSDVVLD